MSSTMKQHLIDPEICIRCHTCEATCPIEAITHNDDNVVVDQSKCNFCMDCIPVCPTGSIDEWRVVQTPYTLEQQFEFMELPEQEEFNATDTGSESLLEALDTSVAELLSAAHEGAGGRSKAPASASKPSINLHTIAKPATVTVQGNYRLTSVESEGDVRHIILDLGSLAFPVLEGQSIGVIAPGLQSDGRPHLPRLYSISSPRSGERPNYNNLSLTVKRDEGGLCSNFLCDLEKGDSVQITGPFGSTFLMPNDQEVPILMICTGTGSAPFRAFTMQRQRTSSESSSTGGMTLVFGARTPDSLPYFGPLKKLPDSLLEKHLVFSRLEGQPKRYVQDELIDQAQKMGELLMHPLVHVYICGLKQMEDGVEKALDEIAESQGQQWDVLRDSLREEGRYHVETY
ncbi:MAG: benzoyl-CoA 2,3-epoxidase subunit BoxA [Granulosicoccus sp.]